MNERQKNLLLSLVRLEILDVNAILTEFPNNRIKEVFREKLEDLNTIVNCIDNADLFELEIEPMERNGV